jgi:molybdenum cofactor cytidylyltransferase
VQFGPTKLTEAQGAILAHSLRFGKTTFKKGRRLSPDDIAALHDAGHEELICARLEPGDVLEDAAADRLSAAVRGLDLRASAAFTGRSNLYAELGGLVVYDPDRLDAFNQVDEAITLGVVPPYQVVGKGQMVATLKIIPFALPNGQVSIAEQIASAETHDPPRTVRRN